ncbi:hypothetical protein L4X63_18405 [Geomonas sp. Red32]|uniref:hypothetical protein n=1 Tax=Geomonas sp. Red32 TaxID=2912856 RepID=UPI00202CC073|nr:hypothetical protein [Geomonas sp. Red32]MCM0083561.1 hypothetical protein [Geomonas sp. Red32]
MTRDLIEDWKNLQTAVEVHDRAPLVGSLFVKILVAAGYSNSEIRLVASTISTYVE